MADPFAPYAGIEGAALTGGEGGDLLQKLLLGVLQGTAQIPQHVIDAARNTAPAGLRREDYTDVPAPGGLTQAWQPGDAQRGATLETAFNLAGVGAPFATSGSAGIFGGRLAATADKAALAEAERLAASGADRQAIWDKTGWFKGADDKWRFEIPDNAAGLNPNTLKTMPEQGQTSMVAGDVWHPKLYEAYPDVRGVKSYVERGPESGVYQGSPGRDELIGINGPTAERGRSVALHELQHVIQAREGFARGGSPHAFAAEKVAAEKSIDDINALLRGEARDMDVYRATGNKEKLAAAKAEYDRLMDLKLQKFVPKAQIDPYDSYRRLAGEVEARNVEKRRDMNLRQLHENPPWMTEDVPAAEQIFRDGGRVGSLAGPQMAGGRTYPVAHRGEWYGDANFAQTGGKMVTMAPDEFLAKARPMKIDAVARENIDDLKAHMLSGKTLDPLAIYKNGKEDGRHRAIAAKELGISEVPVLVWGK